MDLLKQRLTFASIYQFEEIGVRELEDELTLSLPLAECHCEYSPTEKVLIVKGKLQGYHSQIIATINSFIEKQENDDLLETSRVHVLDFPATDQDITSLIEPTTTVATGGLLALDDDVNTIIRHPFKRTVKSWLSSEDGERRLEIDKYSAILRDIANCTGTEIIIDNHEGLQISGRSDSEVNQALAKLNQIKKPLASLQFPVTRNIILNMGDPDNRYRLQPYAIANGNPVALRRILADTSTGSASDLGQIFVTVAYTLDEDVQQYVQPKSFREPPRCTNPNGHSFLWRDFVFTELGKGDGIQAVEARIEKNQDLALVPLQNHPFLSAEKVEQVEEWRLRPAEPKRTSVAHATETKVPGIKQRRAVKNPHVEPTSATANTLSTTRNVSKDSQNTIREVCADMNRGSAAQAPSAEVAKETEVNKLSSNDPIPSTSATDETRSVQSDSRLTVKQDLTRQLTSHEVRSDSEKHAHERALPEKTEKTESVAARTSNLGNSPPRRPDFNPNKYGSQKALAQATKPTTGSSKKSKNHPTKPTATTQAARPGNGGASCRSPLPKGKQTRQKKAKSSAKPNELIDITSPSNIGTVIHSGYSFNAPSLEPGRPGRPGGSPEQFDSGGNRFATLLETQFPDLAELSMGEAAGHSGSTTSESLQYASSNVTGKPLDPDARLKELYKEKARLAAGTRSQQPTPAATIVKPSLPFGAMNTLLEQQVFDRFERTHRIETVQRINESDSRQFHRSMALRAANPGQKAKNKAEAKAKKQATLEEAWGKPKPQKIKSASAKTQGQTAARKGVETKKSQKEEPVVNVDEDSKRFFGAFNPILEAAESFPGALGLEVQFGLIIIPVLPKTSSDILMSPDSWSKMFQSQSGLKAPSTKFMNRVSVCGTEIDHIVNLKTSKAEGKSRIFAEEYSEYKISYEFHCTARGDEVLIIALDEQGNYTIHKPSSILGAVNLHCPSQLWDARAVVECAAEYRPGTHPEFEEAAQHLVDHVWVPAEKQILIYTSLPKGSKLEINKVFVKRWTRHRHLRPGADKHQGETQDLFLQVKEVQDLIIGLTTETTLDKQHVRARFTTHDEMVQKNKLWYELSLVSPAIETILKANKGLEVGERVEDWRSADLFGSDAASLTGEPLTPVAAEIGGAGLADMLRLAKNIVEKMDGVGACNRGPLAAGTARPSGNSSQEKTGLDFDDIESVKEVESVTERMKQTLLGGTFTLDPGDFW
ncbi:hypothetical protein BJY04DRAFT_216061 [Aspergillus karnatakaensis]|uniref:uncharacterized protein n=1 Tax=Aspergillus karnatakaensis TaxID=1810916 RepID=UPI003CCD5C6B